MTRLTIDLPEEIDQILRARAVAAGCSSVEEYVQALVRVDANDPGGPSSLSFQGGAPLEEFLLQRISRPNAGEMTDATFDLIRDRVRHAAKGR
jgi:hypothetical protein